jgi:large subunit ribosomal protein L25
MPKHTSLSKLTLEPRERVGTTSAHALRREGKIPGVVYGHGQATPISVDVKQLTDLIHSGQRSRIVDATIGKA